MNRNTLRVDDRNHSTLATFLPPISTSWGRRTVLSPMTLRESTEHSSGYFAIGYPQMIIDTPLGELARYHLPCLSPITFPPLLVLLLPDIATSRSASSIGARTRFYLTSGAAVPPAACFSLRRSEAGCPDRHSSL